MKKQKILLRDGEEAFKYSWEIKNPKAVMQLVHGSLEHAGRYNDFCRFLNKKGISVFAYSIRGHDEIHDKRGDKGLFAMKDGDKKVIDDIHELTLWIKKEFPNIPYFMLGHSMGSFLVRTYNIQHNEVDKLIVMGTNMVNPVVNFFGSLAISTNKLFFGKRHKSKFLYKVSYAPFNKKIDKPRTELDWLSHNQNNVDSFLSDPLCGGIFTNQGFRDLVKWTGYITKAKNIKKQRSDMPTLFIAGEDDPVGTYGKQVKKAHSKYSKLGKNVEVEIIPNMRHEILNEKGGINIYNKIYDWLSK